MREMGGGGGNGDEMRLIYGFVARGIVVLAEYTKFMGSFPAIATQCLQKLPSSNKRFTYACDHYTFNFLVNNGYVKSPPPLYIHGCRMLGYVDHIVERLAKSKKKRVVRIVYSQKEEGVPTNLHLLEC